MDKPKFINSKEIIDKLVSLDETSENNKCNKDTFIWLFGLINGKRRCNTYDYVKIPKDSYGPKGNRNKNEFTTTVGRFFLNKLFVENSELFKIFKYINFSMNGKNIKRISNELSYSILDDEIDLQTGKDFFQKSQWIMTMIMIIAPNESDETVEMINKIRIKKEEYFKKYKKEIEEKDENTMILIENELLEYGKSLAKDLAIYDLYASGMCSFENHFKDMYVIKGMARDPNPANGYHFIKGCYMDMDKESYGSLIRTQASGPYSRGNLTQTGGEMEKQFVRAYQHIKYEKDTDCKTDKYIVETIKSSNIDKYLYSYIIDGKDKLTLLTNKNKDKFMNKECKIRFSSCCKRTKNGNICHICMGDLPNRLDVDEIGLLTSLLGSSCKNSQMKAFHDGQVKVVEIDIASAFGV